MLELKVWIIGPPNDKIDVITIIDFVTDYDLVTNLKKACIVQHKVLSGMFFRTEFG